MYHQPFQLSGPGLEEGVILGRPTHFNIEYNSDIMEKEGFTLAIVDENNLNHHTFGIHHFTHYSTVHYTLPCNEDYTINIFYQGKPLPQNPNKVTVLPDVDRILIDELATHFIPGSLCSFVVKNIHQAGKGNLKIKVQPTGGTSLPIDVEDIEPGTVKISFTPFTAGEYQILISLANTNKEVLTVPCYPCTENINITSPPTDLKVDKQVMFNVDCTKAGIGELFVNILDPEMTPVEEAELVLVSEEYFEVNYTPRTPGVYTLFMSYDAVPLKNMPLTHNVADSDGAVAEIGYGERPNSVTASGRVTPKTLLPVRPGHPHSIKIELSEAPEDPGCELLLSIAKYDGSIIQSKLERLDAMSYMAHFILPRVGEYAISALLKGEQLPGFPYRICAVPDIDKVRYGGLGGQVKVGELHKFWVDAQQAGIAEFIVKVIDEDGMTVPCVSTPIDISHYSVEYTPTRDCSYTVHMLYGGEPLIGTPLTVLAQYGATSLQVSGTGVAAQQHCSLEPAIFHITGDQLDHTSVTVNVIGPNDNAVEFTCTNNTNSVTVQYTPETPGKYFINVMMDGDAIEGSPFITHITPHINKAQIYPGNSNWVTASQDVVFHVNCTGVGNGPFNAIVTPPRGQSFVPRITEGTKSIFDVMFNIAQEGEYSVELRSCGLLLPLSPYKFIAHKDTRELKIVGLFKNHTSKLGDPVVFEIDATAFQRGPLEVAIKNSRSETINPRINTIREKIFEVSFRPTQPDIFTIHISKDDKPAPDSPYTLTSVIDTSRIRIKGQGAVGGQIITGQLSEFFVDCTEAGAAGDLTVEILDPANKLIPVGLESTAAGTLVRYTPKAEGNYTIYVKYSGALVPPSPFQMTSKPGSPHSSLISVIRNDTKQMKTGEVIKFAIDIAKAGTGKVDVIAEVSGTEIEIEPTIKELNGLIDIEVPTIISGRYLIFVKFNMKDVPGSPFMFDVMCDQAKITVEGAGICNTGVYSKQDAVFDIYLNGQKPSNVVVNVIDPYGCYADEIVIKSVDDRVKVVYKPMKTGVYSIEVLCDDEHIANSPFKINVEETMGASSVIISGNMTEKNLFQFLEEAALTIDCSGAGEGVLDAAIKEINSGQVFQSNIVEMRAKVYYAVFPTYQAGNYEVYIKYQDIHVPYSPFNYLVISKGSEKVEIEDTQDFNVVVYETLRIPVSTKNAGIGKLSSKCHHIRSKTSCKLQTVAKSDGKYDIIFQAPKQGEYLIHIYYNNDEVPQSPVMVLAKAQSAAESYKLDPICTRGQQGEMMFIVHGRETKNMVVRCLDPGGESTPFELKYKDSNKHSLEIFPDVDGKYSLEIFFNGFLISGCPKQFDVEMDKKVLCTSVVVPDMNNIELTVNQSVTFPIRVIGQNTSDLRVVCKDPHSQDVELETFRDDECMLITFRPLKSGEHEMNVLLNGDAVAGSPFKVLVKKPDGAKACTVKQEGIIEGVVKLKVMKHCAGTLQVSGLGPSDGELGLQVKNISREVTCIDFIPKELGVHTIDILVDGVYISGSPVEIDVKTLDAFKGDADVIESEASSESESVSTLQKAIVYLQLPRNVPSDYILQCKSEHGENVEIEIIKYLENSITVRFQPSQQGNFTISLHSKNNLDEVFYSYSVFVQEITAQESTAYAANIDFRTTTETPDGIYQFEISNEKIKKPVFINNDEPTVFILKEWAGGVVPTVSILNVETNKLISHNVAENSDRTYSITCVPEHAGKHRMDIQCQDGPLPGSPIFFEAVNILGAVGLTVEGPGTTSPLVVMEPTQFTINARKAGPGTIEVTVCNAFGYLPVEIVDHDDYTYTAKYQPITIGEYTVEVIFNGESVPDTPRKIKVLRSLPSERKYPKIKRKVKRKDEPIFANAIDMTEFVVFYETQNPIKFKIINVDEYSIVRYKARRHRDGTYSLICRPTLAGTHVIKVYEDGALLNDTPYRFYVMEGKGTQGVAVSGPGVDGICTPGKETYFTIDTNEAGPGTLEVSVVHGKKPVQVSVSSKTDYVFTCKYVPVSAQLHKVSVLFDKVHVKGSPWKVSSGHDIYEEYHSDDNSCTSVSVMIPSKAAYCTGSTVGGNYSKVKSEQSVAPAESDCATSSSLPTLSFSLPVKVSMEDGQKYIKLLLPINELPPASCPKVYHVTTNGKIPAAIVFSRHGYVLKCCPNTLGKYKVNIFDGNNSQGEPLVFFYFNFVEKIRPSTSKIMPLKSIHPTDYFPVDADTVHPVEMMLNRPKLRDVIQSNSVCIFTLPKNLLSSPANMTIANRTTNQYIYTKTLLQENDAPGIMCYLTTTGDYQITIYPSDPTESQMVYEFTVTEKTLEHQQNMKFTQRYRAPNIIANSITPATQIEVQNMDTGEHVPASIKTQSSGEYTIQCEPGQAGKYIVKLSVNGVPVAGSPMFFTINGSNMNLSSTSMASDQELVPYEHNYEVRQDYEVRHCKQQVIPYRSQLPCSETAMSETSSKNNKDAIKPCAVLKNTLADKLFNDEGDSEGESDGESISESTPKNLIYPESEIRSDNPVKILLPYFPEKSEISVYNEGAGKVVYSDIQRKEDKTIVLSCHILDEGRHRVDISVDGKTAPCGPLYFDVTSWDTATLGEPVTGDAIVEEQEEGSEFYDHYLVNYAFPIMDHQFFSEHEQFYDDLTIGYVEQDVVPPVSLSSFSEEEYSDEGEREIRIQSSLELDALTVNVVNEDTLVGLKARLIQRNGDYVVRCRPSQPGHYRVNVRDGTSDVEGSPFYFDVLPSQTAQYQDQIPSASNSTAFTFTNRSNGRSSSSSGKNSSRRELYFINPGQCDFERTLSSSGDAEIVFCASTLVDPQTSLTVEGRNVMIETDLQSNHDGTYTLRFRPPCSGRYKLDVWDSYQTLPGSPFYFDVNETTAISVPENTTYIKDKAQMCIANKSEYCCFKIPSHQYVDVAIISERTGEKISYKLVNEDNEYSTVICKPYDAGKYRVTLFDKSDNTELDISPFYFIVPEPFISQDKMIRSDSPIEGHTEHLTVKSSLFNSTSPSLIFVSEQQGHYLTSRSNSPRFVLPTSHLPQVTVTSLTTRENALFTIMRHDPTSYIIDVPNAAPGKYEVSAIVDGKEVTGTPFTFYIPDTNSTTTEIVTTSNNMFELQNIDECIRRGDPIVLTIVADTHPITRVTNLSTSETIHVDVTPVDSTTYSITFCPFKAGRHEVMIKCQGIQVSGSPFYLDVDSVPTQVQKFGSVQQDTIRASGSYRTGSSKAVSPEIGHLVSRTEDFTAHLNNKASSRQTFTNTTNFTNTSTNFNASTISRTNAAGMTNIIARKSGSSSESTSFSTTEFDDTTTTVFSSSEDTLGDTSATEMSKAVFVGQTGVTSETKVSKTQLSVQQQLQEMIKKDSTLMRNTGQYQKQVQPVPTAFDKVVSRKTMSGDQTTSFSTTKQQSFKNSSQRLETAEDVTFNNFSQIMVRSPDISSAEASDDEEIIDPFEKFFTQPKRCEMGRTVCIKIERVSAVTSVRNLTYGYDIKHRVIEIRNGRAHIRFQPQFDGKYKVDCKDMAGSLDNFPVILQVSERSGGEVRMIDPRSYIPKVHVGEFVRVQLFARTEPRCKVLFLNRKMKVYSCVIDEGMDKYVLCFSPAFPGKYKIIAEDSAGHLAFSPLTIDVFGRTEEHSSHISVSKITQSPIRHSPISPRTDTEVIIRSEKGQEKKILVGKHVNVLYEDIQKQSTFVSVKHIDRQKIVPFTFDDSSGENCLRFSPLLKGAYQVSIIGSEGHFDYSPIILYVEDDNTADWRIFLEQQRRANRSRSPQRASSPPNTIVTQRNTSVHNSTSNLVSIKESHSEQLSKTRTRSPSPRCPSPGDCHFIRKSPYTPEPPLDSGMRSPSRVTFNVSSRVTELQASLIKLEQLEEFRKNETISHQASLIRLEQVDSPTQQDVSDLPLPPPYIDIVYPTNENELTKLYIHGINPFTEIPFIVVTCMSTKTQIQSYTMREGPLMIVRIRPYKSGKYTVELFIDGKALSCSPFTILLLNRYLMGSNTSLTEVGQYEKTLDVIGEYGNTTMENVIRNETRSTFYHSEMVDTFGENYLEYDFVECDIINKKFENITISSKTLKYSKHSPTIATSFELEFEPIEDENEKISPEPVNTEKIQELQLTVECSKYPFVYVEEITTKEELNVQIIKGDHGYNLIGQPQYPGHYKVDIKVDGYHIDESPIYIKISTSEPQRIVHFSKRPASPRPQDIIMMQKKMRKKPKKKKPKVHPGIPFMGGKPIDPINLPVPGLFKGPTMPVYQTQQPISQVQMPGQTTTKTESHNNETTTTTTTRTRTTTSTNRKEMHDSERSDYMNNKMCDFDDMKDSMTQDMKDLRMYIENYLNANIEGDLSDTDDEREGYRSGERQLYFVHKESPYEVDVFSKETKSIEFGFSSDHSKNWCEDFFVFIVNEKTGEFAKNKLKKLENDDDFACFSRIHKDGRYIFEIFKDNSRLFDRRFLVNAGQALGAEGLEVWGPGFYGPVVVNIETWFYISFKKSGAGVLACTYFDADEEAISLNATEEETDIYIFKFTPTLVGEIEIDITFDEIDTPGTPKSIWCIEKPTLSNGATKFHIPKRDVDHVEITVEDFRGEKLKPQTFPLPEDETSVTFVPQVPGKHKINAMKNKRHIKGSPVEIEILDESEFEQDIIAYYAEIKGNPFNSQTAIEYSNVAGSVVARQEYVFAKDPVSSEFVFKTKEPFVGQFRAYITNVDTGVELNVDVQKEPDSLEYIINVRCPKDGKHRMALTVSDKMIPGCPLYFHCIEGLGANGIRVFGQGFTGPHHDGILNVFTLNMGLAGPGVLEVLIRDKVGDMPVDVKDTEDGKILCSYTPRDKPVFMEIMFNKEHVPGSPVVVTPYEGFNDSSSESEQEEDEEDEEKEVEFYYVNENAEMDLFYDSIGDLKVSLINFDNKEKLKGKCTAISEGKYQINFKPKFKGLHMVEVYDGEFQLANSPFFVTVLESKGKLAVEMYGPGITGPLVMNQRTAFTVNTAGAGAGVLEVLVETYDDTVPVVVEDNFNDSITCYYTPDEFCNHTISILYNKEHIANSPVVLQVYYNDPSDVDDELDNGFVVKVPPNSFEFLFVEVEQPDGELVYSSFTALGPDCIKICFESPVHGLYLCNVFYHNVHIKGSPLEILIGKVGDNRPQKPAGDGNYPKCIKPLFVGETCQIPITAEKKLRLDVSIVHEATGTKLDYLIKYQDYGKHFIIFTPNVKGGHTIDIKVKGHSLPNCPLSVNAVEAPGADAAKVNGLGDLEENEDEKKARDKRFGPFEDLDEFGICVDDYNQSQYNGESIYSLDTRKSKSKQKKRKCLKIQAGTVQKFSVDTRGCGEGVLQVSVASNNGEVPVDIKQLPDDTYSVEYKPLSDALLKISITFNGKDVPSSPFTVICGEPKETSLDLTQFIVTCYEPDGMIIPCELFQTTDGNIKLKFCPVRSGKYRVEIMNGDHHIQGSPFMVHVNEEDISKDSQVYDIYDSSTILISELKNKKIFAHDVLSVLLEHNEKGHTVDVVYLETGEKDSSWRLITIGPTTLVSWQPERGGRYMFTVTCPTSDTEQYLVIVIPVIRMENCLVGGPAFEDEVYVGDSSHFQVDCITTGNTDVKINVEDSMGKIPVLVEKTDQWRWKCTFHPIKIGPHNVKLYLDDTFYNVRPLNFPVLCKVEGSCCLLDMTPPVASVGVILRLLVSLVMVTTDDVVISVLGPDGELLDCSAKTFDGKEVNVEFKAFKEGCHRVKVTRLNNNQVEGSPMLVDVQGAEVVAQQTSLPPRMTSSIVRDGDTIQTQQTDDSKVESTYRLARQFDIDREINVTNMQSSVEIPVIRSSARRSREVRVASQNSQAVSQSDSVTDTHDNIVLVGDEVNFVIRNVTTSDYNISINGPPGCSTYCFSSLDQGEQTFGFKYVPNKIGDYCIKLFKGAVEIAESPIVFKVYPVPSDKVQLVVQGEGINSGTTGAPTSFDIITSSTGNLTVSIDGPCETRIDITDRDKGGCHVTYHPLTAGTYYVHLGYAGVEIEGSPFKVQVADPAPVKEYSPVSPPDKVYVNEPFAVRLKPNVDVNNLIVSIAGPDHISTKITSRAESKYHEISYIPNKPGQYQLIVNLPSGPARGSPYSFTALPRITLECEADGTPLSGIKVKTPGKLVVRYNLANPQGISYEMKGAAKPTLQISRQQNCDLVEFSLRAVGEYKLYVKYNGKVLKNSPFVVRAFDFGHFDFMYLKDALKSVDLKKKVVITLDMSSCGPGKLEGELEGPLGIEEIDIKSTSNHISTVKFTCSKPGHHKLFLNYSGVEFPLSPFSFFVSKKSSPVTGMTPEGPGETLFLKDNPDHQTTLVWVGHFS